MFISQKRWYDMVCPATIIRSYISYMYGIISKLTFMLFDFNVELSTVFSIGGFYVAKYSASYTTYVLLFYHLCADLNLNLNPFCVSEIFMGIIRVSRYKCIRWGSADTSGLYNSNQFSRLKCGFRTGFNLTFSFSGLLYVLSKHRRRKKDSCAAQFRLLTTPNPYRE